MDPRLERLVSDYQARVAEAVAMLEAAGIQRPSSNLAWTQMEFPGRGNLPGGFTYYKHGFGCAVDGPEWGVDFDFGEHGEINGFDAYRLHDFARRRLKQYGFSSAEEIEQAVENAHRAGDLTFSGYILFYVSSGLTICRSAANLRPSEARKDDRPLQRHDTHPGLLCCLMQR